MKYLFIVLTMTLLISCDNGTPVKQKDALVATSPSQRDSVPVIDTVIILKDIVKSNYTGPDLTIDEAKKVLYSYFRSKGYYTPDNLPDIAKLTDSDKNKLSADYDTIFVADLNGNKNRDAVILYWLAPPYANGHCMQPHKAIISDTEKGYKITNEEFIPPNFSIDSVLNEKGEVTIYGYDYECANHKVLKHIRARIK